MRGFTLLELLVVLVILALASGGVVMALRDNDGQRVQREAQRLVALLEAARAESRASGTAIRWEATDGGFSFTGEQPPRRWLYQDTRAVISHAEPFGGPSSILTLGPEPIIPAQQVTVIVGQHRLKVGTDGLQPFLVMAHDSP
jgi:general secretion pathway protein H